MTRSACAMHVGIMLSAIAVPLSAQASAGSFVHLGISDRDVDIVKS